MYWIGCLVSLMVGIWAVSGDLKKDRREWVDVTIGDLALLVALTFFSWVGVVVMMIAYFICAKDYQPFKRK